MAGPRPLLLLAVLLQGLLWQAPLAAAPAKTAAVSAAKARSKPAKTPEQTPAPAAYTPAMWRVSSPGTKGETILFGTIHSLPRGVDWFRPPLAQAVDSADRLVMETTVPDGPGAALPAVMKLARQPAARPEEDRLPENWRPAWRRAKDRLKPGNLEWYDTWYIALTLANLQALANGMDPRIGAEAVLTERARMRSLAIEPLETIEQQLIYFDALNEADQQQMLMSTLADLDSSKATADALVADWLAGRTDALAAKVNEDFSRIPMLRRMLVEERNQRWAAWIDSQMKAKPGKMLVAVGAGHLAGSGSLISELEQRGYTVERMAPAPPPPPKHRRR